LPEAIRPRSFGRAELRCRHAQLLPGSMRLARRLVLGARRQRRSSGGPRSRGSRPPVPPSPHGIRGAGCAARARGDRRPARSRRGGRATRWGRSTLRWSRRPAGFAARAPVREPGFRPSGFPWPASRPDGTCAGPAGRRRSHATGACRPATAARSTGDRLAPRWRRRPGETPFRATPTFRRLSCTRHTTSSSTPPRSARRPRGARVEPIELRTGTSPMFEDPEALADVLDRVGR